MIGVPCTSSKLWKSKIRVAPAWDMGSRCKKKKKKNNLHDVKNMTPGPQKYNPKRLNKSHSYSFGIRLSSASLLSTRDLSIPCATKYNSRYSYKAINDTSKKWTIQSRTILQSQTKNNLQKPGPTKYFPKPNPKLPRSPSYSFRPRLNYKSTNNNPGPQAYYISSTISKQQYPITIKSRKYVINKHKLNDPAPNQYRLTNQNSRPHSARCFSLSFRNNEKSKRYKSPGPIYNPYKDLGYHRRF